MVTQRDHDLPTPTEAFHAGDERALAEIYDRWSPLVYSLALRALGDIPGAEQVTQRVFTEAWTSRRAFDPAREQLPAWLVGITCHAIAACRAARAAQDPSSTQPTTATPEEVEPADLARQLVLADELSRLDPAPEQVLRLAFQDELDHVQIAERLRLSPAIVTNHIRRSLLRLRERLEMVTDAH